MIPDMFHIEILALSTFLSGKFTPIRFWKVTKDFALVMSSLSTRSYVIHKRVFLPGCFNGKNSVITERAEPLLRLLGRIFLTK